MESEPGKGKLAGYVMAGNGRISALFPELRGDGYPQYLISRSPLFTQKKPDTGSVFVYSWHQTQFHGKWRTPGWKSLL